MKTKYTNYLVRKFITGTINSKLFASILMAGLAAITTSHTDGCERM